MGEDVNESSTDSRFCSDGCDLFGEVVHVSVAGGGEGDLLLVSHGKRISQIGSSDYRER